MTTDTPKIFVPLNKLLPPEWFSAVNPQHPLMRLVSDSYAGGYRLLSAEEDICAEFTLAFNWIPEFAIPGLEGFSLLLRGGDTSTPFTLIDTVVCAGDSVSLTWPRVRLVLQIESPLLTPATYPGGPPATDALQILADGTLTLSTDTGIEPTLESFSIPPFTLGAMTPGLVLSLEGCRFDLDTENTPGAVRALGFDDTFRGIYARRAVIHWLPAITLQDSAFPGLRMDFEHVALGDAGVSFDLALSWPVVFDAGGNLDPAGTELMGSMFSDLWQVAIASATGSVRVNVPEAFSVSGYVRVPLFQALFSADFALAYRFNDDAGLPEYGTSLRLALAETELVSVGYPDINLQLFQFDANGFIGDDGFSLAGEAGFEISIFGFEIETESASVAYSHLAGEDKFTFGLRNVALGDLGNVPEASLIVEGRALPDDGFAFDNVRIIGEFRWSDIADLIPSDIPGLGLPDEARIRAEISWMKEVGNTSSATMVVVELLTEASHLDELWGFIPAQFRPEVHSMQSFFRVAYDSVEAFTAEIRDETSIQVELSSRLTLKLPAALLELDVPGLDLLAISAGDADGIISAEYRAEFETDDENTSGFTTGLNIENPIAVDISLPGGVAAEPLIVTSISKMGLQLAVAPGDVSDAPGNGDASTDASIDIGGALLFEGQFEFRPLVPTRFPFADQLNSLLRDVGLDDIRGRSRLELSFDNTSFDFKLSGEFDDFGIELDVFTMLATLASPGATPGEREIDVDFDIGFKLVGFEIAISNDPGGDAGENVTFSFDLTVECNMTGLPEPLRIRLRLSDDELSLGITDLLIPLEIPQYPVSVRDFDQHLADANGVWSQTRLVAYTAELDDAIATRSAAIDVTTDQVEAFSLVKDRVKLEIKKMLLQAIMVVHDRVGADAQQTFQALVYADTLIHESILGVLHFETELKLLFPQIKISIPFDNPTGIAISGEGRFTGFSADDPLKGIEAYSLVLGLSSEYIFARLTGGAPVPLPAFGTRYDDGSISISSLSVGYGYSKNSFAFDFSGELVIPTELINDADTSEMIGAGIRLPRHNKLFFKLDTIVLTIGKITVAIPLPQFDIDLRTPGAPGLVWDGARSRPYWDGFELLVPGAIHADFKRLAFSPFFGFFLLPNVRFDGDLELGDAHNGATLILDDLFVMLGLVYSSGAATPIPLIADPAAPYFENVNANIRLFGFEVNFDLKRPFPSPSPMSIIEALGLVSNPMMEIQADGTLANIVRFHLDNAYVRVPDFVVQMFPGAAAVVDKRYGFTLNFGTLITLVQSIAEASAPVIDWLKEPHDRSVTDLAGNWSSLVQEFDPWTVVKALPPELRKFRLGGQVAGFSASACLVIATPEEARASLRVLYGAVPPAADTPAPLVAPAAGVITTAEEAGAAIETLSGDALRRPDFDANLPASSMDGRRLVARSEAGQLLAGIEFRHFREDDLDLIPDELLDNHDPDYGGVFLGAYLRVFSNQKIRFLGRLYENGSFALVSAAETTPLQLAVFGIPLKLPFAGYGRLLLSGGQKRSGAWGRIRAQGAFDWSPIPGVLRIIAGVKGNPAIMQLYSDGRFEIAAPMTITLFNGAAQIDGTTAVSNEKLAFDGRLRYGLSNQRFPQLIGLDIVGAGVLSAVKQGPADTAVPTASYSFHGRGDITLLGRTFADISVDVSDRTAAFEMTFRKAHNSGTALEAAYPILQTCELQLAGRGRVNLRRNRRPDFEFEGRGEVKVLGARLTGRGGVRARPAPGNSGGKDYFEAYAEGDLRWQGRTWLGGRLTVGSRGLSIAGSTRFALKITPSQIPGSNTKLAHLFIEIGMDGEFVLDPAGQQMRFLFKGAWTLGAGLPDTGGDGNRQILPLASAEFTFDSVFGDELTIFDIEGFGFLPLQDIEIPKPDITISATGSAETMVRAGKLKGNSSSSAVEFWTPLGVVGFEGAIPMPYWPGRREMQSPVRELFSAYEATVSWENVGINLQEWSDLTISLALRKDAATGLFPLRLILRSGSGSEREVYF